MNTTDIINSELTTIDLATLNHVNGGYHPGQIFGKAVEGAVGGFLSTPGDWRARLFGAAAGAWVGGDGEYNREADAAAAAKADRLRRIQGG
jgi:hypothetical protein